ncbi:MAG: glycosyltransferase family 4 protein [Balneolaceae bacterium]|nr:glycosyltransferase family 4 protein [Balneolaceae bacterium]
MKILQVHNKYKISGGEWTVFNQEYDLLKQHHSVEQLIVDNRKEISSIFDKLKLVFSTHYNKSSKKWMKKKLEEGRPDLMHVHNFFPLLTPSIFDAAREAGIPSVLTLHNFRLIHPNGLMYHKGKIDTRSVTGSAYRCVSDAVYRDSKLQTAVVAHMIEYHRKHETWKRVPTLFIALTEFSKQKFIEGGLPGDRIVVKPNFIEDPVKKNPGLMESNTSKSQFIYVGRISHEKGIEDLLDCWMKHNIEAKLVITGDGPLRKKLEKKTAAFSQIQWLGEIPRNDIITSLAESRALIFPTRCFEGLPMILVEAMSVGCPVITSKIGNPRALVDHEVNGLHFEPGNTDHLHEQIRFIQQNEEETLKIGKRAREKYLNNFTPEQNYRQLLDIYRLAIEKEDQLRESKQGVFAT